MSPSAWATKPPTKKQADLLAFIAEEILERGRPPTLRDMAIRFEKSSTNAYRTSCKGLETRGFLVVERKVSRGIQVTPAGYAFLGVSGGQAVRDTRETEAGKTEKTIEHLMDALEKFDYSMAITGDRAKLDELKRVNYAVRAEIKRRAGA